MNSAFSAFAGTIFNRTEEQHRSEKKFIFPEILSGGSFFERAKTSGCRRDR